MEVREIRMTMTNRSWLKNLSDEQLAKFLINVSEKRCIACNAYKDDDTCDNKNCEQAITEWLKRNYHQLTSYEEECPYCGKKTHDYSDKRLLGICERCSKEIKICSVHPGICPWDTASNAEGVAKLK